MRRPAYRRVKFDAPWAHKYGDLYILVDTRVKRTRTRIIFSPSTASCLFDTSNRQYQYSSASFVYYATPPHYRAIKRYSIIDTIPFLSNEDQKIVLEGVATVSKCYDMEFQMNEKEVKGEDFSEFDIFEEDEFADGIHLDNELSKHTAYYIMRCKLPVDVQGDDLIAYDYHCLMSPGTGNVILTRVDTKSDILPGDPPLDRALQLLEKETMRSLSRKSKEDRRFIGYAALETQYNIAYQRFMECAGNENS